MFKQLQQALQKRYDQLASQSSTVFYKDINREEMWETYLNAFPPEERQENTCNCCKSFIRQFGGITFIVNNKAESIWGFDWNEAPEQYRKAVIALYDYVSPRGITDVFFADTNNLGSKETRDNVRNMYWNHFYLKTGTSKVAAKDIASKQSILRSTKEVFKRALIEFTVESLETVSELIAQGTLYRGSEKKNIVNGFLALKRQFDVLANEDQKDNFAWVVSIANPNWSGIRNDVVGTLIEDISLGIDLDAALRKYENKTAPSNYQRPVAAITPRMIESAKKEIEQLGFMGSLERRFANEADLDVNDILFVDKTSGLADVFGEMIKGALVNPKTLSKVEEITIVDFLKNVVPTAKSIDILAENNHLSNLLSITTAQDPNAATMFKWNNPFAWAYAGGIADSMKERVKAAGGNVNGVLRFSIQWNDKDTPATVDYDAHAYEPDGTLIYYGSYKSYDGSRTTSMSGYLDVDMINPSTVGVENITWTNLSRMRDGDYRFIIHNFNGRHTTGFKAQVEFNGEIHDFYYGKHVSGKMDVATVNLKNGVFTLKPSMESKSNVSSQEKWGLKTNTFTKVRSIMLSPNYWQQQVGNKHYIFLLDGVINNEPTRAFFNEFLKPELHDHRKVFEVMGGKLTIPPSTNQLSGLGFSETVSNQLIVQVTSTFKRQLKIKF